MKAEELEIKKEVHYWAGRLIGHEQNYDIAEEIIQFAEDYANEKAKPLKKQIKELKEDVEILRDKLFFDGRKKV